MQSQNRIFDDIAKVAGGALGALGSLKQEIETLVRQRVERFMADRDLVSREESGESDGFGSGESPDGFGSAGSPRTPDRPTGGP